ncbi:hypothetical protein [Pseudomonas sp. 9Ag]|uniref:hypothetical protein n=1 Tax=Pseudomonas sp. 9Ag TaxID=2653167 RepID=UPI0012F466E0|nr:hypothetical protein [Pseudomonas sp. 9Ag]VXC51269.1 conserved hypothetical protein [Pseudomonas sp. 9Ag]
MTDDTGLLEVVNEQLSAISFVHDYIEFQFNEKIIRSFTCPILRYGAREIRYPENGSRDDLCSLIGCTANYVTILADEEIKLGFSNNKELIIPLTNADEGLLEAMHYVPGHNRPIEVW